MAVLNVNKLGFQTLILISLATQTILQSFSIEKILPDDCITRGNSDSQERYFYFDISQLMCRECAQTKEFQRVTPDGLQCICQPRYRLVSDFGGGVINCEECPSDQIASDDGWSCVECGTGNSFDDDTNICSECDPSLSPNVIVERNLDGSWDGNPSRSCEECVADTAPNQDGDRCERCSQVLSVLPSQSDCTCPSEQAVGGVCFEDQEDFDADGAFLVYDVRFGGSNIQSEWLTDNMQSSYGLCKEKYQNTTACTVLTNMCVLTLYPTSLADSSSNKDACALYLEIFNDETYMPQIYVSDTNDALTDNDITTEFKFPDDKLKFKVAMYSYNGTYLGMDSLDNGLFQFCKNTESYMNAAYTFGTTYSQICDIDVKDLYDMETILYDVFLEYRDGGADRLYRIPIRILDLGDNNGPRSGWSLNYRMFLVDNVLGRPYIDPTDPNADPRPARADDIRYASRISIHIELQDSAGGKINPPLINVEYSVKSKSDYDSGTAETSFKVDYNTEITQFNNDMGTAAGVLCGLALFYGVVQAWGWSKRQGQASIDCFTLVKFMLFSCGNIANVFFVVAFGGALYYWIFFKNQETVVLLLPSRAQEAIIIAFVSVAFCFKFIDLIHLIVRQVTVDIFFIDWERPRGKVVASNDAEQKGEETPISIWRTYFAANEYNEIQSCRKFNHVFQKFVVVLFLSVIGFENIATRDPQSNFTVSEDEYSADYCWTLRFAIGTLAYILVSVCQWIFHTFIYERFIEDKVRQYVDFCSMSNISLFIFENSVFGYYIHGRSVHGRADTGMAEMAENMKREEEDLCGQRGLLPNTEQQTFQIALPSKMRTKYDQVLLPILNPTPAALAIMKKDKDDSGHLDAHTMKCIAGYGVVNRFFMAFIDHSLKSIDYYVKDKMLLESILDVEFESVTDKGFFYNDNGHSFDQVLFYGNEMTLTIFDILLFAIIDLIFNNFVLAAILTYFADELIAAMRDSLGRRNLANKTLIDKRFLI